MASAALRRLRSSFFSLPLRSSRPISPCASKTLVFKVNASTSVDSSSPLKPSPISTSNSGSWKWKFDCKSVNIHFERVEKGGAAADQPRKDILLVPTISDVSTVAEWRDVAEEIVGKNGGINWSATIVDWPGLGYSDRPKLHYNANVMEKFLVDFVTAPDSPVASFVADNEYVIFGGGHAATIAVRATKNGLLKPKAIAAVTPTWAGTLPIAFGSESKMKTIYHLLRGTLRAPTVGRLMYNGLIINEKAIESQYISHLYANPKNVTPAIVKSRYALTKREGARYVPAAFLTGKLDPVSSREEFVQLFAGLKGHVPVLVLSTSKAPTRSKAEMEALMGAKGVSKYVEVAGALLPQEEYPKVTAEELYKFLLENFESEA